MKILYVGTRDRLTEALFLRLGKEEHELYLLSDRDLERKKGLVSQHRFFKLPQSRELLKKIISSICPEIVIYAGFSYLEEKHWMSRNESSELLPALLEEGSAAGMKQLIYFSTTGVYGTEEGKFTEESPIRAKKETDILHAEEETLIQFYQSIYSFAAVILRCEPIFFEPLLSDATGFWEQIAVCAASKDEILIQKDWMLQPVAVQDVCEAVCRVLDKPKDAVYNLAGSDVFLLSEIYQFFQNKSTKSKIQIIIAAENRKIITKQAETELEWTDFKHLRPLLEQDWAITTEVEQKQKQKEKNGFWFGIRTTIENLAVFAFFAFFAYLSRNSSIFSEIEWMMLYVIVASLMFGIRQSAPAVLLAGIWHLAGKGIFQGNFTSFYSYSEDILAIAQFILMGILVSYTVDMLKERVRSTETDMELLRQEYADLQEINDENVLIKQEYEKRLLDSKMSLPKLYSILSQINVLQPDKIFMEILNIIADMLDTNTAAVYLGNGKGSFLRLVTSLNPESVIRGRSWDIAKDPEIQKQILAGEIYAGNVLRGEPAFVAPVGYDGTKLAVIVIAKVPFQSETLYEKNLFRTLILVVSEALAKAVEYENEVRFRRYLGETGVLCREEFIKQLSIAEEKKENGMADYCLLRFPQEFDYQEMYQKLTGIFRDMDWLGLDAKNRLYVLLSNTSEEGGAVVIRRLQERGLYAELAATFTDESMD